MTEEERKLERDWIYRAYQEIPFRLFHPRMRAYHIRDVVDFRVVIKSLGIADDPNATFSKPGWYVLEDMDCAYRFIPLHEVVSSYLDQLEGVHKTFTWLNNLNNDLPTK